MVSTSYVTVAQAKRFEETRHVAQPYGRDSKSPSARTRSTEISGWNSLISLERERLRHRPREGRDWSVGLD